MITRPAPVAPRTPERSVAEFVARLRDAPCCAAVVGEPYLDLALDSAAQIVFVLRGDGLGLRESISRIHAAGKLAAIHLDLVDGLSADAQGVAWLSRSAVLRVVKMMPCS